MAFTHYADPTDIAERTLAAMTTVTAAGASRVTLNLLGTFSAGPRSRVIYDLKIDGDSLGSIVQWTGEHLLFDWGLTLTGVCSGFGFSSLEALLIAVDARRAAQRKPRKCLSCLRVFASTGPGNRRCGKCRDSSEYRTGSAIETFVGRF